MLKCGQKELVDAVRPFPRNGSEKSASSASLRRLNSWAMPQVYIKNTQKVPISAFLPPQHSVVISEIVKDRDHLDNAF